MVSALAPRTKRSGEWELEDPVQIRQTEIQLHADTVEVCYASEAIITLCPCRITFDSRNKVWPFKSEVGRSTNPGILSRLHPIKRGVLWF